MEDFNVPKDGQDEDELRQSIDSKSGSEKTLSKRLNRSVGEECLLILDLNRSRAGATCSHKLFISDVNIKIPKQILSIDERYLLRYLELIHIQPSEAESCYFPSKLHLLLDGFASRDMNSESRVMAGIDFEPPFGAEKENVMISTTGELILGTLTGSKSMINILKSPLLNNVGILDYNANLGKISLLDSNGPKYSDLSNSPGGMSTLTQQSLQETMVLGYPEYKLKPVHRRLTSISSTNSTWSDDSSSSSRAISQGMLQLTWKDGLPHYVLSVDDKREVYVANVIKVESSIEKFLDYVYTFHSTSDNRKEREIHRRDQDLVGKMNVCTSLKLCSNNSQIMETQFILFGLNANHMGEMQTSGPTFQKNKGLTKNLAKVFRTSQSYKQRSLSKFSGKNVIFEDISSMTSQDVCQNVEIAGVETPINLGVSNLELAAIIFKDHITENCKKVDTGGWGLKFLKEPGVRRISSTRTTTETEHFECCQLKSSEFSTSMDILVPAGYHGGPAVGSGRPSSLTERWSSGGHCDCGGWDIGCPITILKTKVTGEEAPSQDNQLGDCRTFDLFVQGSKQTAPAMKMTNVHDGLYYIHFHSNLSALQSFAIAAAIIHTQTPLLRSKVYRS